MRPIVADRVGWYVGLSVTVVSSAKTAEPIKMPFALWTRLAHKERKPVLVGGPDPRATGQFLVEMTCTAVSDDTAVSCAKITEPIEMSFGLGLVDQRKHMLHRRAHWHNLSNRLNRPFAATMQPYIKLL